MNEKQMYESPAAEVVVVTQERLICASQVRGRNAIRNWDDGDTLDGEVYM